MRYSYVLAAVEIVWNENPAAHSINGETLEAWQKRRKMAVAKRLHELLFPERDVVIGRECDHCHEDVYVHYPDDPCLVCPSCHHREPYYDIGAL